MTKRIARRYSDGSFNVTTEGEDVERARRLLAESEEDADTELVEVDITITRSFGRPILDAVPPDTSLEAAARAICQAAGIDPDVNWRRLLDQALEHERYYPGAALPATTS